MVIGLIRANLSSGISGAAAKGKQAGEKAKNFMTNPETYNVALGKADYYKNDLSNIGTHLKNRDFGSAAGVGAKSYVDNVIAADYKGEGGKRVAAIASRAAIGMGTSALLEGGYRYATGQGSFTSKNGQRDIAGIPFI